MGLSSIRSIIWLATSILLSFNLFHQRRGICLSSVFVLVSFPMWNLLIKYLKPFTYLHSVTFSTSILYIYIRFFVTYFLLIWSLGGWRFIFDVCKCKCITHAIILKASIYLFIKTSHASVNKYTLLFGRSVLIIGRGGCLATWKPELEFSKVTTLMF